MYHEFDCDNCGGKIETGCFDERDNHRTYYSPMIEFAPKVIRAGTDPEVAESQFGNWLKQMSKSAITILCITCVKQ